MVNKNNWEIYTSYSKKLPFWVIDEQNKPTYQAYDNFISNEMTFYNGTDLFRYDERTLDSLTIITKDPDIKYISLDMSSSTPIVSKPFLYKEMNYYVERASFYAQGVWKLEFKRDYITIWIQFLLTIMENSYLNNIRTLTTRTNLINDNYQFEDEKLKELPLKINGWNREELIPANGVITRTKLSNGKTQIVANYERMFSIWETNLTGRFKTGQYTFEIPLVEGGDQRTSFQEYYVFNTEEYGMVFIPRVNFSISENGGSEWIDISIRGIGLTYRIYHPSLIEGKLVNGKWPTQFMGVFILPNWLTTSIDFDWKMIKYVKEENSPFNYNFDRIMVFNFGIDTKQLMSINYNIPSQLKVDITKNKKLNVKDKFVSFSILQVLPTYLNYINEEINLQKYPQFFDLENDIMNFKFDFIFSGIGINTYYTKYLPMENWIKTLPNQLPSSTSQFAQFIQANQNTLQTGIWVKKEEAKLNALNGVANSIVGIAGATISATGIGSVFRYGGDMLTKAYAQTTGSLGIAHGTNQAIQGITNTVRAFNEVKFEKARVKAKYVDTFNSSTRQINYAQAIDALSKEFIENNICDILIYPIIENIEIYNDTIVRSGNKTYEYFKLENLLKIPSERKYNYFEINSENFFKETTNYPQIWDHFTFEQISLILDWLENGIRLWKTIGVEYDYQE